MIVRTFMGTHIDLSKVISISDAYFINKMGFGGWFVGFDIHIQLLDEPIHYSRGFVHDEYIYNDKHELIYGRDGKTILAVERLQHQINDLIKQWKLSNER